MCKVLTVHLREGFRVNTHCDLALTTAGVDPKFESEQLVETAESLQGLQ